VSLLGASIPAQSNWSYQGDNSTYGNVHFSMGDGEYKFVAPRVVFTFDRRNPWQTQKLCTSNFEASCLDTRSDDIQLQAALSLPVCENGFQTQACIGELSVGESKDSMQRATFVRYLNYAFAPSGGPYNLPTSAAPSIWSVEVSGQTDFYLVAASYNFVFRADFKNENFGASVWPVEWHPGSYPTIEPTLQNGLISTNTSPWMVNNCLTGESNGCFKYKETDGPRTITLGLTTKFDSTLWINARMSNTEIEFRDLGSGFQSVTVSGDEAVVYGAGATIPTEQFNAALGQDWPIMPNSNQSAGFPGDAPNAFDALRYLASLVGDKAQGSNKNWSFSGGLIEYKCPGLSGGFVGYVSTDSMVYEPGRPDFNGAYFNYRVGGLHYAPDGQKILGSYVFGISMEYARCLYGFSRAPVSATVSVIGDQGEEKIATTIVSERDGWLKLAAYGFTFSEKQIQVQLRQSQQRTLTNFTANSTRLTNQQRAEIRAVMAKSAGNGKFICTGIRFINQPVSENIRVRARAKAACDYAKSLNPKLSYWFQTKTTTARNFNGRVIVVSKN